MNARKASRRELAHRYLAWLDLERRCLAHELKATEGGKLLVMVDDQVESFFYPLLSRKRGAVRSTARAAKMLRAAGISTKHDPQHFFFGEGPFVLKKGRLTRG